MYERLASYAAKYFFHVGLPTLLENNEYSRLIHCSFKLFVFMTTHQQNCTNPDTRLQYVLTTHACRPTRCTIFLYNPSTVSISPKSLCRSSDINNRRRRCCPVSNDTKWQHETSKTLFQH